MIFIKNPVQIQKMRDAGKVLYEVLQRIVSQVKPGITTKELDIFAENLIRKANAIPSFLGYMGFPASICTSINQQVVHGIPSHDVVLNEGDIISIDCGVILDGWQSDSAITVGVGKISAEAEKLIKVTEECFFAGVRQAVLGKRLGDLGEAIQNHAEKNGFYVIKNYTGHGIGKDMHEEPSVYNYRTNRRGIRFMKNMTLAVEPMIAIGTSETKVLNDEWTVETTDGSLCSHYEHTILINDGLPELLSYPGFTWKEDA
ncbi:MAG: type I methionyl aminopeptidase [Christensenellaceae bacterium]|nr:type I methionyl aminopeptidase [Christensenellaceae bacterium]